MPNDLYPSARNFLLRNGRLLDRRLFAARFEGGPGEGVVDALRGYQNDDGGFGHALEPDTRCPDSLPLHVELALKAMVAVGTADKEMVERACDYLASVADADGAVALASPVIEAYPRAEHVTEWTYIPGVFPTAGLVAALSRLGVQHPWIERARAWCWSSIAAGLPDDAHALAQVMEFLEVMPDRARAESCTAAVAEQLPNTTWYRHDPDDPAYGVRPLDLAPAPDSFWRPLFADDLIDRHLDRLERDQQDDGGWAIAWEPPSEAAVLEWRGAVTLRALRTLGAYGRI